jgi:hypothetical protein
MLNGTITTHGRTSSEGKLDLHLDVGLPDTDVVVVAQVRPAPEASDLDENGWPKNFFATVSGSMPELRRWDQGNFEHRLPFE